ncbi:hypothetical protein LCGC14_2297720 [marine sediment metagenome]|uniref:Lipoprotein n=1 Tax=marine sediment metagenome TaxID=412755 RepID=A0A0F9DBZ9_9ZZZZ|nr:hypothetical protein [Desulfobacterales bacterium]
MKSVLIAIGLLVVLSGCAFPPKPSTPPGKPFVSGGCAYWPDGDYFDCYFEHDKDLSFFLTLDCHIF